MEGAEQRSIVAKVRVYELAKEFGVESKAVMAKLEEMGEFVRSASSTIEAPVVRRLKEAFNGGGNRSAASSAPRAPAARRKLRVRVLADRRAALLAPRARPRRVRQARVRPLPASAA